MEEKLIAIRNQIIEKRPIVQCITNAVTVNDCANLLLAAGASVTMAHHPLEVGRLRQEVPLWSVILAQSQIMRRWKKRGASRMKKVTPS